MRRLDLLCDHVGDCGHKGIDIDEIQMEWIGSQQSRWLDEAFWPFVGSTLFGIFATAFALAYGLGLL